MVEAAGIEPASEGIPLKLLHAYPAFWVSLPESPDGLDAPKASLIGLIPGAAGEEPGTSPMSRRSAPALRASAGGTVAG